MLRKGFYLFDLLLVALVLVFSWPDEEVSAEFQRAWWLLPVIVVPLLLRVGINVMLYRRMRGVLWAIVVFMALFLLSFRYGVGGYAGRNIFEMILEDCEQMRGNTDALMLYPPLDADHFWLKVFLATLYGWVLFVPPIICVVRKVRRQ